MTQVCLKVKRCLKNFGSKWLIMLFICQIVPIIKVNEVKHHNELNMEKNETFHIWKYLEVLYMLMCHIMKNNQS